MGYSERESPESCHVTRNAFSLVSHFLCTCAPQAVLEAMGGRLTDVHGNAYAYSPDSDFYNRGGVMAAMDGLDFYLDNVPQAIKNKL